MWRYRYSNELYHYGVKGMKWGVRRSKEELKYDESSIRMSINRKLPLKTKNGVQVKTVSIHAPQQASRRKVTSKEIVDALKNPLYISDVKIDKLGRKSQRFVGNKATAIINPDNGVLTTIWHTGSKTKQKYSRR